MPKVWVPAAGGDGISKTGSWGRDETYESPTLAGDGTVYLPGRGTVAAIGPDGVVYTGNTAGILHAFQTESYGYKSGAPWPTHACNSRRTSCIDRLSRVRGGKRPRAARDGFSRCEPDNPFNPVTTILAGEKAAGDPHDLRRHGARGGHARRRGVSGRKARDDTGRLGPPERGVSLRARGGEAQPHRKDAAHETGWGTARFPLNNRDTPPAAHRRG